MVRRVRGQPGHRDLDGDRAGAVDRLLAALRICAARYYKLTPAFTLENLRLGHGFHFLVPATDEPEIFLDVLGAPPRLSESKCRNQQKGRTDVENQVAPDIKNPIIPPRNRGHRRHGLWA